MSTMSTKKVIDQVGDVEVYRNDKDTIDYLIPGGVDTESVYTKEPSIIGNSVKRHDSYSDAMNYAKMKR